MVKSQFSYGLPPFSHGFLKESPLSHHKGLPGSLHPHRMHPGQCPAGWRQDAFGAAQWGAGCAAGAWEFAGGSLGNHWVFGKIAQHGRLTHGNIDKNERFLLGKFLKMEVVDVFSYKWKVSWDNPCSMEVHEKISANGGCNRRINRSIWLKNILKVVDVSDGIIEDSMG